MNERILELVKQAGGHFSTQTLTSNPVQYRESIGLWDKNIEKFAELIVRECAEVCRRQQYYDADDEHKRGVNSGSYTCMNAIKQHFGVEE